jgi:hypothetical protein
MPGGSSSSERITAGLAFFLSLPLFTVVVGAGIVFGMSALCFPVFAQGSIFPYPAVTGVSVGDVCLYKDFAA